MLAIYLGIKYFIFDVKVALELCELRCYKYWSMSPRFNPICGRVPGIIHPLGTATLHIKLLTQGGGIYNDNKHRPYIPYLVDRLFNVTMYSWSA
jgi:hypothetical protein